MGRRKKPKSRAERKLPESVVDNRPLYYINRPFGPNGIHMGLPADRGLIIRLHGQVNDEKLTRIDYVLPLLPGSETFECGKCGSEFRDMQCRDAHVKKRHTPARVRVRNIEDLSPQERQRMLSETLQYETEPPGFVGDGFLDQEERAEERMLEQIAPLNLEHTAASRK